uniref:Uncharacterized protein n=1 Tax=Oryza punctata TaxID=4537 RepID=A0A0E0MHK9_ORYPU
MAAGGDRLSKLEDEVLGHILSFLPAREAARASALSSRWRHVFAAVHTVSMAETDADNPTISGYDSPPYRRDLDPFAPPVFSSVVTTALLSRHRRRRPSPGGAGAGTVPLRALRVDLMGYMRADSAAVDQWVSYAVQQAAADHGLEIDLRLARPPICDRAYSLREGTATAAAADQQEGVEDNATGAADDDDDRQHDDNAEDDQHDDTLDNNAAEDDDEQQEARDRSPSPAKRSRSHSPSSSDYDDDDVTSDEQGVRSYSRVVHPLQREPPVHTIPSMLFSCAVLWSLTLGSCGFALPATVALPSVETLLLSHVNDPASDVQRLVSGCPRLADLMLEACGAVTAVTILAARLRRLAIRCCHNLAAVAVDASELHTFEYRGAVPGSSTFLTLHHGDAQRRRGIACCHVDICGEEATSEKELTNLRHLLQLFADDATHLHLQSARLGAGADKNALASFPTFHNLRHLELWGSLPDDAAAAALTTVTTILMNTPELETLSLVFHRRGGDDDDKPPHRHYEYSQNELAHQLRYNPHAVLAAAAAGAMVPCLRSTVREINLVHYQGGMVQRSLAKFLLCNAPAIAELFCLSAEGPLFTLEQLKQEIKGWLMNRSAKTVFK